jgi:hypothetical protein
LGARDPFIALEDADLNLTVTQAAHASLLNTGQNCIAAKRVIVVRELAEKFTKLLFKASKKKYYYDNDDQVPISTLFLRFHDTWSYLFQVLLQIRLAVARLGHRIITSFSSSGQGS